MFWLSTPVSIGSRTGTWYRVPVLGTWYLYVTSTAGSCDASILHRHPVAALVLIGPAHRGIHSAEARLLHPISAVSILTHAQKSVLTMSLAVPLLPLPASAARSRHWRATAPREGRPNVCRVVCSAQRVDDSTARRNVVRGLVGTALIQALAPGLAVAEDGEAPDLMTIAQNGIFRTNSLQRNQPHTRGSGGESPFAVISA